MLEFISKLFDTSDFPPRWQCGNWSDFLGWLHVASDLAIFAAYFAIPAVLLYFARKREDFPFTKLFWLFAGFIFACGTIHLIEATIFWYPAYRVSGLVKFLTAVVSWVTVIALVGIIPKAIQLPSLAATNARLQEEITQRTEVERELRAANARHDALLAGTSSIVWTASPEGNFITPQAFWERYTGQTRDEYKDRGWIHAIHEDDRNALLNRWNAASSSLSKYQSSGRIWHEDSQAYRAFVAEAVPVIGENGQVTEWVGTVTDIHDEHQAVTKLGIAQSELAKQKRELELIYEAAPVGMSLIDRDYRFLRINKRLAEINGFPQQQHIGQKVGDVLGELNDQLQSVYEQIFASGQPILDLEIVGRTPASPFERVWLASYYPLMTEQDDATARDGVTAISAIVQDITDRKHQEQRLRDSEQMALAASRAKSEFLANMSHEIRTPMAAILGYADVLLGHLKDPDNRNCVLIMKRNGQCLLELINDILDLSRIEAGRFEVVTEDCNLPKLVGDVQSLMRVRADEKKLDFSIQFETPVPESIHTDAMRLRQVLINLIGNAIKFTERGEVTLIVRLVTGNTSAVEFAVRDTGIGISDQQQTRLFKPFSQGDASVTQTYGGSGLGLAISQRLIEMLGGEIRVDSRLGDGSTFTIRLPIDSSADMRLFEPELNPALPLANAGVPREIQLNCRVLVVDDRRDVRHISQHFLEKAGAKVSTAEDGRMGIDAALAARDAGQPFDVIVMDMQMPNVDGMLATAELRSAGIQWPIIALTADAMKGDRERCLNAGCDDYLSKPIDHKSLIEMIWQYTAQVTQEELQMTRKDRAAALRASMGNRFNMPES